MPWGREYLILHHYQISKQDNGRKFIWAWRKNHQLRKRGATKPSKKKNGPEKKGNSFPYQTEESPSDKKVSPEKRGSWE